MSAALLGGFAAVLFGLGVVESLVHRRRIRAIPIRIHVAGTRGKSSVTRLVAGGLRQSGIRTVAKTTGSLPCFISTDGRDTRTRRKT